MHQLAGVSQARLPQSQTSPLGLLGIGHNASQMLFLENRGDGAQRRVPLELIRVITLVCVSLLRAI